MDSFTTVVPEKVCGSYLTTIRTQKLSKLHVFFLKGRRKSACYGRRFHPTLCIPQVSSYKVPWVLDNADYDQEELFLEHPSTDIRVSLP
jgi:hypothetical protein